MEGTVRTLSAELRDQIPEMIEKIAAGICQSYGASYNLDYERQLPPVYNHPEFVRLVLPWLFKSMGEANVVEVRPQLVAEDFAFYAERIPAFYFFLGVKGPAQMTAAPLHSPNFNPDERAIPVGIKAMCHLVLNALEQQASLKTASEADSVN